MRSRTAERRRLLLRYSGPRTVWSRTLSANLMSALLFLSLVGSSLLFQVVSGQSLWLLNRSRRSLSGYRVQRHVKGKSAARCVCAVLGQERLGVSDAKRLGLDCG